MRHHRLAIALLVATVGCGCALAQAPVGPASPVPPPEAAPIPPDLSPVPLEWTPPALVQLSLLAETKSNFTFDRSMLQAADNAMGDNDPDARSAISKLDGVSVHLLRFAEQAPADPDMVESIREAYHLPGWKHVVSATDAGGPVHDSRTDVWVVMQGVNVRGAVVLLAGPRGLTLATVAGNLSPVDLLHLRGHFGIPRFDRGDLGSPRER